MSRNPALCIICLSMTLPLVAQAQTQSPSRESQLDELKKETAQLKALLAEEGRRIAELEKVVKALQAATNPAPAPIPSPTPQWQSASNWRQIKKGMSEAQVVDILGPPTRVDASIDVRTLVYQPDSRSTLTINGSVTLTDDRVTAMKPPAF